MRIDPPAKTTAAGIRRMILQGVLLPGDVILVQGRMEALSWFIARAQNRLLKALYGISLSRTLRRWHAKSTHAIFVESVEGFAEMYRPTARRRPWEEIPEGSILVVKRLLALDRSAPGVPARYALNRNRVVTKINEDIENKVGYSVLELLRFYWISWGWKMLTRDGKFSKVFVDEERDSCASWCMEVFRDLGLADERPEAWYPARISADTTLFYAPVDTFLLVTE